MSTFMEFETDTCPDVVSSCLASIVPNQTKSPCISQLALLLFCTLHGENGQHGTLTHAPSNDGVLKSANDVAGDENDIDNNNMK